MTLSEYMAEIGLKDEPLAKMIGVERSTVTKLRLGTGKPSFKTLIAIERVTNGKVRASDFVEAA
jgi:transcriptional regulator with XRE-family HTH domain